MLKLELINLTKLNQHEQILKKNLQKLTKEILSNQFIIPILVDIKSKTILDGHHRYNFLKSKNYKYAPCYLIDYQDNNIISVFPRRKNIPISKNSVIQMGLSNKTYPPKTTKHVLNFTFQAKKISLKKLF